MLQFQDVSPEKKPRSEFGRMYHKSYMDGHNILNGDCIVGGLLQLGRQQHKTNGQCVADRLLDMLL